MKTKSPSSTSSSELGSDREGLIALPDATELRTSRVVRWFVLFGFASVTAGTGLTDTFFPVPRPRMALHQELDYAARQERAHVMDGSAARLLEYELRLTSRVRNTVAQPYSTFLYESLREPSAIVIRGEGDWLFMRERTLPPQRSDEDLAGRGSAAVAALDRRVHSLDVPMIVVPIPRKSVMHADKLPSGIDSRVGLDRVILDAIAARGVQMVDLLRLFQEQAKEGVYYPCDSHWSAASQLLAAEEIVRVAGRLVPDSERRTVVREGDAITPPGRLDLLKYMDVRLGTERLRELRRQGLHNYTIEMRSGAGAKFPEDLAVSRRNGRIAISGTSYSDGKFFSSFLGHYSQSPILNGAMSAADFAGQVRELLLRRAEFPGLELVVFEFPVHQLFFGRDERGLISLPDSLGLFMAENLPPHLESLKLPRGMQWGADLALHEFADVGGTEPNLIAGLSGGALFHTGDGIAAISIRGAARGPRSMIEVHVGGQRMRALWPEGADRVVLPLIDARAAAHSIRVLAHGTAGSAIRVDSLELVVEPGGDRTREIELGAPTTAGDGWTLRTDLADALPTRRFAALVADADFELPSGLTEIALQFADAERPSLHIPVQACDPSAALAIHLGAFAGLPLMSIELRGIGEPSPLEPSKRVLRLLD